jgi:hypothetical protein
MGVVQDDTQGCAARIITRGLSVDGDSHSVQTHSTQPINGLIIFLRYRILQPL